MAGRSALHEAVISLHFKDLFRVKPGFGELAVHVRGNHKVFLPLYHLQQMPVERLSFRGEEEIIPHGDTVLLAGDVLVILKSR